MLVIGAVNKLSPMFAQRSAQKDLKQQAGDMAKMH